MWSLGRLVALALCIQILQVQMTFGQDLKKCIFRWANDTEILEDTITLPAIQDIEKPGKELLVAKTENVVKILEKPKIPNDRIYMDPILNATHLILNLTDAFTEYEENESEKTTTSIVTFGCTDGTRKMEFVQPIEDTNNHKPTFIDDPYIYNLPMPFPKNLALDNFAPISARDIDFTNTNITFWLEPGTSGFSVSYKSMDSNDRKRHYATLVTTEVINLVEDLTFKLYANDTGKPVLTGETTVTIKVDKANSVLRFAQPFYTANLSNLIPEDVQEADHVDISFPNGDISLATGADKSIDYSLQHEITDYDRYMALIPADDSTVKLRLIKPPSEFFQETYLLLRLTAKKPPSEDTTILHLSLPGINNSSRTCFAEAEECDECGNTAIIVLSILVAIFALGLVGSVIMNIRARRKLYDG